MGDDSLIIESVEPGRLLVQLRGRLEEDDVRMLTDRLIPGNMGTGWELLMDLTEFEGCTYETRLLFVTLQRALAEREVRTAFVARRPRFRGMALWIAHVADDPAARAFHHMQQAEAWLGAAEGRVQSIVDYLGRPSGAGLHPYVRETPSQRMARLRKRRSSSDDGGSR